MINILIFNKMIQKVNHKIIQVLKKWATKLFILRNQSKIFIVLLRKRYLEENKILENK